MAHESLQPGNKSKELKIKLEKAMVWRTHCIFQPSAIHSQHLFFLHMMSCFGEKNDEDIFIKIQSFRHFAHLHKSTSMHHYNLHRVECFSPQPHNRLCFQPRARRNEITQKSREFLRHYQRKVPRRVYMETWDLL
jgi:hypothetical protein